ncbi:MAG: hypothetical protein WDN49_20635 [Acetobacteraceae bacterium]
MRILFSGILAAGLLASQMAAAQNCARPADKTAFDVAGLKSQLMVTAITCEATERYNTFILRYRPDLLAQEKVLNAYFSRNFGKRAQAEHDDYITSLANTQSESGLKAGTAFCNQNISMFDQVMALHGGAELADFATNKATVQPIALVACAATPGRPARAAVRQASAATTTSHRTR